MTIILKNGLKYKTTSDIIFAYGKLEWLNEVGEVTSIRIDEVYRINQN